jgi:hypothetical protein
MLVRGGFGPLGSTVQLIRKLLHSITHPLRMGKHDVTLDRMCRRKIFGALIGGGLQSM